MKKRLVRTPYHLPYNPDLKEHARTLRKNMTNAEKKLWQFLRRRPEQWLRQRPIDNFSLRIFTVHHSSWLWKSTAHIISLMMVKDMTKPAPKYSKGMGFVFCGSVIVR